MSATSPSSRASDRWRRRAQKGNMLGVAVASLARTAVALMPALLIACTEREPEAEDLLLARAKLDAYAYEQELFRWVHPEGGPLRLAIVWLMLPERSDSIIALPRPSRVQLVVSFDEPVRDQALQAREFELRFEIPETIDWSRMRHEQVWLPSDEGREQHAAWSALGYRPRVLLYQDVNANGELDLAPTVAGWQSDAGVEGNLDGSTGARGDAGSFPAARSSSDRVLASDRVLQSVIAWQDPKRTLRSLSRVDVKEYYQLAPGFSHFAFVHATRSHLSEPGPVGLSFDHPNVLHSDLICERQVATIEKRAAVQMRVDALLDAQQICGLDYTDCEAVDFLTAPAPTWDAQRRQSDPSFWRIGAQCKTNGELDALLILERRTTCEYCYCTVHHQRTTYVARSKAVPAWWPCGNEVSYCNAGSLHELSEDCPPLPRSPHDTTADAGAVTSDVQDAGADGGGF